MDKSQTTEIIEYINGEITKINRVETAKSWEETLGRQEAIRILNGLIRSLDSDAKVPNKNQYQ